MAEDFLDKIFNKIDQHPRIKSAIGNFIIFGFKRYAEITCRLSPKYFTALGDLYYEGRYSAQIYKHYIDLCKKHNYNIDMVCSGLINELNGYYKYSDEAIIMANAILDYNPKFLPDITKKLISGLQFKYLFQIMQNFSQTEKRKMIAQLMASREFLYYKDVVKETISLFPEIEKYLSIL